MSEKLRQIEEALRTFLEWFDRDEQVALHDVCADALAACSSLAVELAEQDKELEELKEALHDDPEKWSFWTLLTIAELILASDYPPDVFTGSSGDPGPRFVVRLREAVDECRALAVSAQPVTEAKPYSARGVEARPFGYGAPEPQEPQP